MSQAQLAPMTKDAFLAWEARQDRKWEFDGVQPVAMAGGTRAHAVVQRNLLTALANRLGSAPCQAFGSDLKIQTSVGCRYPDASVSCTPFADSDTEVASPVIVFEVLSPSTATDERTTKLAEYQSIASVRRYVMLEQDRISATVITRTATGWEHSLAWPGGTLDLPEIGVSVPMAELYGGLEFPAAQSSVDADTAT